MSEDRLITVVDSFILSREAADLSPRTVEFYVNNLRCFLQHLGPEATLADLTVTAIETYLIERKKQVRPRSVHCAWRAIRALCNWLATRSDCYPGWDNPASKVAAPKLPNQKAPPVKTEVVEQLLHACRDHDLQSDRNRAILLVLASSGLRSCELLQLKQEDVDLHTGKVYVAHGKGDKERIAIISPQARAAIAEYLNHLAHRAPSEPLWWGRKGPLTYSGLDHALKMLSRRAGVNAASAHAFRRRWATDMAPRLGPWVLQALGGWSSLESVKPYISLSEDELLAAYTEATKP